jgi:tetratricopeptide (TPR) repeat protein
MKITNTSLCFLFIFLSFSTKILSQSNEIDSIKIELQNHKQKDTLRVNLLNDLANLYFRKDLNETLVFTDQAIVISDSLSFKKGNARGLFIKGLAFSVHLNYETAIKYYNEALYVYKELNHVNGIINCYSNIGYSFFKSGNYKAAIEYYSKLLEVSEKAERRKNIYIGLFFIGLANGEIGNYTTAITYFKKALVVSTETNESKKIANCLCGIGNIYSHQGNYPLALEYHNKALKVSEENADNKEIGDALMSIANVYIRLQNYDKAIVFHEKALELSKNTDDTNTASILNNLGEAYMSKKNFEKAHEFFEEALKKFTNKGNEGICLNNIGYIYLERKDYNTAYQYFEKSKKINLEVDNQRGLSSSYLGIAQVLFNKKEYEKALANALKSKELSAKLDLIDIQRDGQQLLSKIYENTGNYKKALESHEQFKILNDSLFNKENIEKITQLEYEYKYKQALDSASIRELKLTKTVKATSQNLEKSQRNYLLVFIGFLLVSMALGSIIFYQKYRNIKSKNQTIVLQQKLLRSQMTPHFIFNSLSVLQGMILNKEEKKSINYLSRFSKLLRITLENSRDKMVLLSEELNAVEYYLSLQNLEDNTYKYSVLVDDTIDISLFKIPPMLIQPFVENAIEHAFENKNENKKIDVHLSYLDKKLTCTIMDNGIGINVKKENKNQEKKSLATTITSERLEILSKNFKMEGSIHIEDRKKYNEQGTIVTIIIPHKIGVA